MIWQITIIAFALAFMIVAYVIACIAEAGSKQHAFFDKILGGELDKQEDKLVDAHVTPEEVAVLFQGERRQDTMYSTRMNVWNEHQRMAYRQMRMEDWSI